MERTSVLTVDVVIPCYQQAHFIGQTIDSVLAQTYPHVETIVVDDGSPDDTPAVAARYGDRIRYIRKENAGVCAARNTGILAARGDFILFLDGDDYLQPDTAERHIEAAHSNPTGAVFHSSWQRVDSSGRVLGGFEARPLGPDPFHTLLEQNRFPGPLCLMIRRSTFANVGLFHGAQGAEDWDMWIRLAAAGYPFVAVPDAVAMYRCHPSNLSKSALRMWLTSRTVLRSSKAYHRNCPLCRKATRLGMRNVQEWCFDLLTAELDAALERGDAWTTLVQAARWQIRTPCLPGAFVRQFPWYLLRMIVRHVRWSCSASRARRRLK